jgi:hypothetical protein
VTILRTATAQFALRPEVAIITSREDEAIVVTHPDSGNSKRSARTPGPPGLADLPADHYRALPAVTVERVT